ncbi:hypothetical protein BOW53_05805 [Solemya pervernicosa gill symbiont]|uniref:PAS domain S-box protein n=2 Tax=Solemya pervernicosa gill symbiont TaxID=642797 RepID=A0A1T2L7J7_9GAMM|nr:hypothetical protein BOW53_05805 [Solemya pervernicosa gill symbiont]
MHIIRDISEQKKVRQALEESEESYRALFETSADALMLLDESHSIFDVNRAAVELFGFDSIDEMQGLRPADLSPERQSNGETVQLAIEKVAQASTQGMLFFEWLHTRKSGELFTADVLLSRVPIKGKEVIQATVRDISMRKEMEKQLEHEIRARRVVSASNQTLVHAQDESSLLQKACELICHEESYPLAMVGLKQDDTEKSIKVAGRAGVMTEADVVELGMTWSDTEQGQNMTAVAIRNSQIQINRDAQKKARCKACKDLAIKYDYHSILSFPLIHDGRVLGGLTIAASDPDAFSEEEIELLSELASDLSYGIVSLRSKEKREHAEQAEHEVVVKLERSTQKTVQAIASAIEVRDPYTAGHQQRVALLATAIANEMEMDENSVIGLALGATIHDIGKIYVPAEILNRPGKLTDAEFEIIKSHPRVGHDIIKEIDFPWPVGNMVLMHHERLDGSGYPQGLKGDEIPIEARILAVADVVEAIDSHRPYRPTLGIDFAMEEINKHRGSWYDSAVVDACVALIEREGTAW